MHFIYTDLLSEVVMHSPEVPLSHWIPCSLHGDIPTTWPPWRRQVREMNFLSGINAAYNYNYIITVVMVTDTRSNVIATF